MADVDRGKYDAWWNREGRRDLLMRALLEVRKRGVTPGKLETRAGQLCHEPFLPRQWTTRRAADKGVGFKQVKELSGLLVCVADAMESDLKDRDQDFYQLKAEILELLDAHNGLFPEVLLGGAKPEVEESRNLNQDVVFGAFQIMRSHLALETEKLRSVYRRCFQGADDEDMARFVCYRHHAVAGRVVKSFLIIKPPVEPYGVSTFSNFVSDRKFLKPRRVDGLVLQMGDHVYLVGAADDGSGLKIIAMDEPVRSRAYVGLLMSMDEDKELICSRFLMKRTELQNHDQAGIDIFEEVDVRDEYAADAEALKNVIDFKLVDEVVLDDTTIGQPRMVEEVARLLRDKEGRPRMLLKGKPFNPAASDQYPYNSALALKR
jgi:hypothetical protein